MSNAKFDIEEPKNNDNIVRLTLAGSVGKDEILELKEWAKKVRNKIRFVYDSTDQKVLVLINLSNLKNYSDPEAITILAELMKDDHLYVKKTASFGSTLSIDMARDVVKSMAGRKDVRGFPTEKEALDWLKEN